MITAVSPEPALSASTQQSAYRFRAQPSARPVLPDSTPPAARDPRASDDERFPKSQTQSAPQPELAKKDSSSIFAAAVISGALSPTPKTMDELMMRIGSSTIPEDLQARLKDFTA